MSYLSFKLSDDFIKGYENTQVDWKFAIGGGNTLSEISFYTLYSRVKEDGTKEQWYETCRRVIEGMYSILKDHCIHHKTPWNHHKAMKSAQEAYDRLFHFKWTPAGRGLWMMGTELVNGEGHASALENCAFLSTGTIHKNDPSYPFVRLMDMSAHGIGVGFDTEGAGKVEIFAPNEEAEDLYVIEDSREGWCESLKKILESYFKPNKNKVVFDYSLIRPAGAPLKRFGGTASGPAPLEALHESLREQFADRAGETITSRDIVDIMNKIGKAIIAGSSRRSAELALGNPNDDDFLNLKNWELEDNKIRMGFDGWGYMSNNSVVANVDGSYDHLVDSIKVNGEPGLIFLDLMRSHGRLVDGENNSDYRVVGVNPCLTADTWVMTAQGPRKIHELIDNPVDLVVDGKEYRSSGFWKTGTKEIVKVVTADGRSMRLTPDHRVLTLDGWVEIGKLSPGDHIVLNRHENYSWFGPGETHEGYLIGSLIGDGTFSSGKAILNVWEQDQGKESVMDYMLKSIESLGVGSQFKGWSGPYGNGWHVLSSASFTSLVEKFGVKQGSKNITEEIEKTSSDFHIGFLRSLFDTDGSVQGNQQKGVSVRLTQANLETLEGVQRMLLRLGINSTIYFRREEGFHKLPDGNGGMKSYFTKPIWELVISKENLLTFRDRVGFLNSVKAENLDLKISEYKRNLNKENWLSTIVDINDDGIEDVYDVTVDEVHAFDANGFMVHNCAEQSLENNETCNLVETYPLNAESSDDYLRTLKFAYLYGKAVTLLPTKWPETNEVRIRNRRIGVSMTGLAEFVEKNDWTSLRNLAQEGYKVVEHWDKVYSEWLGVRESIKMTTIKPSGSVSLVTGQTPGVHWPVKSGKYLRRQRLANTNPLIPLLEEAGYPVEPDVMNPNTSVVVTYPVMGPEMRDEKDVSIWEKMALAAEMQNYWSDNAVSATFTFKPEESKDLPSLIKSHQGKLKTMSFLPLMDGGSYAQMPYEAVEDDVFDAIFDKVKPLDWAKLYGTASEAVGEKFCDNDTCVI